MENDLQKLQLKLCWFIQLRRFCGD